MKKLSVKDLAKKMKELDFCMMTTADGRGSMHSRPMSNNREVEYDGNSYFFSYEDTGKIRQLRESPLVSLTFQGKDMLFIQLYGHASIITQKGRMKEHWSDDLNRWFPEGLETEGVVMIHVEGKRAHYWAKENEGMLRLDE
ncbi:pyridoxamine 5'-phosphate oxidase family protein [Flavilitoribacter nigricans]|uniref:Pyridoxamine 5'-phosphate oxidase n=1 Tax=Flavilitoribacter nigricans (strain ATCC 23147 / DSM 23189 / NBRC 102662 / NCIMB 1420 / SS-2) TaxID=1122177 RepID=A0A2D0NBY4_FLAN2|nr:pyridoxamine 5'-phosphate oxidase family protein [Flavilitoribacter nigricans]PHN06005.1 pyridoxamine 5'-phosphate oxidase [Flavilitoribacter nigricans DSM 23189 = NBRC 102662]